MKEFKIEVPKGFEIDKENSTFEIIKFKKVESKYPKSVKEVEGREFYIAASGIIMECNIISTDLNQVSTKESAEAFLALMQLTELRGACNEIDGGKDFVFNGKNYCIEVYEDNIIEETYTDIYRVMHFRKESTRNWFMKEHSGLLETAKYLL